MAAITWKCPNCGGELLFDPSTQKYRCPYCASVFSQEELEAMTPQEASEQEVSAEEAEAAEKAEA